MASLLCASLSCKIILLLAELLVICKSPFLASPLITGDSVQAIVVSIL